MGRKRRRHGYSQPTPIIHRKKGTPGWMKALALIFILVIGVAVAWYFSSKGSPGSTGSTGSTAQGYPAYATGVFYSNPTILGNGTKIQLPYDFVKERKIVFVDAKLSGQMTELTYQGRTIPLSQYKSGDYLPLIALYTPLGNVITGIRTCEPCGSFSMHIEEGKYLTCDSCGTKWDIETFTGISGGCPNYPPPKLTSSVSGNIEIDFSSLGIKIT